MPGSLNPYQSPEARHTAGLLVSPSGLAAAVQRVWNAAFDLVFPPACAGCGRVGIDSLWCPRCTAQLEAVPLHLTRRPFPDAAGAIPGTIISSGSHEGKLQTAIHALKYDGAARVAPLLAARLLNALAAVETLPGPPEVVIPLPLHRNRQRERGYNQSALLAQAFAEAAGLPCLTDAVQRVRDTRPQVGLNRDERQVNVLNAFTASPAQFRSRIIVVIDDVVTTGATLSACASALLSAGASAVYGLTVTAARHPADPP